MIFRVSLDATLLKPAEFKTSHPKAEVPFEEIKLVLGMTCQRGRWDGGGADRGCVAEQEAMADAWR